LSGKTLGDITTSGTISVGTKSVTLIDDSDADGIDDNDTSIITADKAYSLAKAELLKANQIGDTADTAKVTSLAFATDYAVGDTVTTSVDGTNKTFTIGNTTATAANTALTNAINAATATLTAVTAATGASLTKIGTISDGTDSIYAYLDDGGAVIYDSSDSLTYTTNAAQGNGDKSAADVTALLSVAGGTIATFTPDGGTATTWTIADDSDPANSNVISGAKAADLVNEANGVSAKNEFQITKASATVANTLNFNLHVGADADMTNKIQVNIDAMDSSYLGIKGLNVSDDTGNAATYAIDAIADAISKVSSQRSALGAIQNRLEHTINNLDNVVENTTSAESRIRDTDMAEEMVEYSKNNILAQAGQSMLAQANQSNQGVLSLLQ
jgi:flagellin